MKNAYICGPTVYDNPHIGNIRPILTFDIIRRAIEFNGEEVKLIHNITDIDDKIIKRAKDLYQSEYEIARGYENEYIEILEKLNIIMPDHMPRVTDNMELIVEFVQKMVDNGSAYVRGTNVYFSVGKAEKYGEVSNQKLDKMQYDEEELGEKEHPADFALWKDTIEGVKYDSPWGKGRPGWHTECSAFVEKYLDGDSLDIHGGGIDLIFPHHENENVQYRAVHNAPITNTWSHTGHLHMNDEKMSKSLGNVIKANKFISDNGTDVTRMIFLLGSPSGPINLSEQIILDAKADVEKLWKAYMKAQMFPNEKNTDEEKLRKIAEHFSNQRFSEGVKEIKNIVKNQQKNHADYSSQELIEIIKMLGFVFTKMEVTDADREKYAQWEQLRAEGKYEESDTIRYLLQAKRIM